MKRLLFVSLIMGLLFNISCTDQEGNNGYQGIYEGKPRINPPYITGNYPATPFLFYIPTSGERPLIWNAENLPQGLSIDRNAGIISGIVNTPGEYHVMLTAKNKFGETTQELTIAIGDKLALTPTMGWNSWNTFGKHLTQDLIIETAEAMIENGMRDMGYNYINIDDFWQLGERGEDGHIQIDMERFPNGIKYVADYLHTRGFKVGVYSDAAEWTCGGVAGSFGFEEIDAADFASWGVDLLKYDYCHAPQDQQIAMERYAAMGKALKASGRSIVYSVCEWGQLEPWTWAKEVGGHYWRTTWDIRDKWHTDNYYYGDNGVMNIVEVNAPLAKYAEPGAWNDPDMLIVGISGNSMSINEGEGETGCTPEQYRSHMSLWAMMAAPLLSGNDVRNMDEYTIQTLTNPDIIAINQDRLGKQAELVLETDTYMVFVKPLSGGREAVAYMNKTDNEIQGRVAADVAPNINTNRKIKDVWEYKQLGKQSKGIDFTLQPYQCKIFIMQ